MPATFRAVPDWFSWDNEGGALAVGSLSGDGTQDLLVLMVDNTALWRAERAQLARLRLSELVSEISTGFIELPPSEIGLGLTRSLRVAGEAFEIDRAFVALFAEDQKSVTIEHAWERGTTAPLERRVLGGSETVPRRAGCAPRAGSTYRRFCAAWSWRSVLASRRASCSLAQKSSGAFLPVSRRRALLTRVISERTSAPAPNTTTL